MQPLLSTTHIELSLDPLRQIVSFKRTAAQLKDFALADSDYLRALAVLDTLDRSRYHLLVDLRSSPLRNDPAFEGFIAKFRARMFSGFSRTAILVRTAVGELQMNRLQREGKLVNTDDRRIFREEQEALAYLQQAQSEGLSSH